MTKFPGGPDEVMQVDQPIKSEEAALSLLVIGGTRHAFTQRTQGLLQAGLRPLHAEGLEGALFHVRRSPPGLILVDLDALPHEAQGICRRLRALPEMDAVPLLLLSDEADPAVRAAALEAGGTDWLPTSIADVELRARLRAAARQKRLHDRLADEAHRDALTGLWNRRSFDRRLWQELVAARHEARPVSLLLIDLDHFKELNDQHGHLFGDLVLGNVAAVLARAVRSGDSACRYGGEEFAVILRDAGSRGAEEIAERIRSRIAEVALIDGGRRVPVTASVGIASTDDLQLHGPEAQALVEAADLALYAAKQQGRNRVCQEPARAPRARAVSH